MVLPSLPQGLKLTWIIPIRFGIWEMSIVTNILNSRGNYGGRKEPPNTSLEVLLPLFRGCGYGSWDGLYSHRGSIGLGAVHFSYTHTIVLCSNPTHSSFKATCLFQAILRIEISGTRYCCHETTTAIHFRDTTHLLDLLTFDTIRVNGWTGEFDQSWSTSCTSWW